MTKLEDYLRTLKRKRPRSADTKDQLERSINPEYSVNPKCSAHPERSANPERSVNPECSANLPGSLG